MKRLMIVLIVLFVACAIPGYADNSARITELKARQAQIIQEVQKAQDFIQQAQVELAKTVGAIEELNKQDAPVVKEATNNPIVEK